MIILQQGVRRSNHAYKDSLRFVLGRPQIHSVALEKFRFAV